MQAEHGTTDATSLSAIVGRVWKEMPQAEKQVYFDRSKQVCVFGVEGLGERGASVEGNAPSGKASLL